MNYTTMEEFGNRICISVTEIMGADYEAVYKEVSKNNGVCLHSIMISKKGSNVSPSIYIDELYNDYTQGMPLSEVVCAIIDVYKKNATEINMDMSFFTRYGLAKGRILYKLIHWDRNSKLLREVPHIRWNDLAVVFYYLFEDIKFGKATILVRNSHLAMWGIDFETLYSDAKANMIKMQPEELIPIKQVIRDIVLNYKKTDLNITARGLLEGEDAIIGDGQGPIMYVLSSRDKYFGAAVLLYSQSLKKLAGRLNRNLIILPSSVHEVLLLPDDNITDAEYFRDMVKDVNDTHLEPEEILSYNVYYYNRFTEQISVMQ